MAKVRVKADVRFTALSLADACKRLVACELEINLIFRSSIIEGDYHGAPTMYEFEAEVQLTDKSFEIIADRLTFYELNPMRIQHLETIQSMSSWANTPEESTDAA